MRLSNSKVKTYRRCPNRYRYKYVEKLEKKRRAVQLERGSWIHDLLQHYYDGEDWKAQHRKLARDFNSLFEEEREHLGDLPTECLRIVIGYLQRYGKEDAARYRVIDSELDEIVTLPNGLEFNFIIDLIMEDLIDGGLWLWDHKTVKSFMPPDFMLVDSQLTRYFECAELMGYEGLRGVMFNEIRTKPPAIPEVLKDGSLSKRANMDTTYSTYMKAIKKQGLRDLDPYREMLGRLRRQEGRFFRRTHLPRDKPLTTQQMVELHWSARQIADSEEHNEFPRSPDKACDWDCDYKDICIAELMGADPSSIIKTHFQRRSRRGDV